MEAQSNLMRLLHFSFPGHKFDVQMNLLDPLDGDISLLIDGEKILTPPRHIMLHDHKAVIPMVEAIINSKRRR